MVSTITYDSIVSQLQGAQQFDRYTLALCAFHSDSKPSMLVFKDGWFRCLGCSRHGKWVTLWNKLNGQNVRITPENKTSFGPPLGRYNLEELCYQAHEDIMQFDSYRWYMEMRGLEDRIETNEIGYFQGWYTFPVRDREGDFKTAVLRSAPHVQETTGWRYWCKSQPMMYVPDWHVYDNAEHIFVVFGILDALTLSKFGYPVVTSTAGNLTFRADWLDDIRRPIYVLPDVGEEAVALGLVKQLGWRGKAMMLDYPKGTKDPNGFLEVGRGEDLRRQLQIGRYK